jgi:hypothetical protein
MEGEYSSESMMQQAQQVWSMLDDMADNDPGAYKAFIDKQMAERNNFMAPPEPHMCVKTEMVVSFDLMVNLLKFTLCNG